MGDTGTVIETPINTGSGYSPLRRMFRRFRPGWASQVTPGGRANWKFLSENGLTVLHGPFEGLQYPGSARGHVGFLGAKVLGAYELELHDALEEVIARGFDHVVDIGSGEGYYVVGLARRMGSGTRISAFELDTGESAICAEMATLNGVGDIVTGMGECTPERLRESLGDDDLVISDCEGFEVVVLDPDAVPQLRTATVLAELHPHAVPDIVATITGRFGDTHDVQIIRQQERIPGDFAELADWEERPAFLLVSEGWLTHEQWAASGRCWAYMTPKQTA